MGNLPGCSFAYKRDTDTSNIGPSPNLEVHRPWALFREGTVYLSTVVSIKNTIEASSNSKVALIRPELIIHLNLPIIQIFYSQICSLLFNNMSLLFKNNRDRMAFSSSRSHGKRLVL